MLAVDAPQDKFAFDGTSFTAQFKAGSLNLTYVRGDGTIY